MEGIIEVLRTNVEDRDRENAEMKEILLEKDRLIAQLRSDLAWSEAEVRQYRKIVTPPGAAEVVRERREVMPPVQFNRPYYAGWARIVAGKIASATNAEELEQLRDDNREHIAAFEAETPGAGKGIEQRINERLADLMGCPG